VVGLEAGDGVLALGDDDALAAFDATEQAGELVFGRGYISCMHLARLATFGGGSRGGRAVFVLMNYTKTREAVGIRG
jgi:hypothetical protein